MIMVLESLSFLKEGSLGLPSGGGFLCVQVSLLLAGGLLLCVNHSVSLRDPPLLMEGGELSRSLIGEL